MKPDAPTIDAAAVLEKTFRQPLPAALCDLFKARLTLLILFTTLIGYYLGSRSPFDIKQAIHTLLATAILACGAAAFNQLLEREQDAKMRRTQNRPLPTGRFTPALALAIASTCATLGLLYLALAVNPACAALGAATILTYVLIYTPLKKVTVFNTIIGAIPGALPILIGWTAARGQITPQGWSLFAIVFFWQLPHFLALAWIYRDDLAQAGFRMLPAIDPTGERTARYALCHTTCLGLVSGCPTLLHLVAWPYLVGALVLGLALLGCALRFALTPSNANARRLFQASIVYLPLLLGLMAASKTIE